MTMTFDASDDELKVFLQEADEMIALLQNDTIRLEKEYQDETLVQSIFRAAHTLKGSSGMIGHVRMTNLTHAIENILDRVRKGNLIPTPAIVDAILLALDGLNVLREEVATKEESDVDLEGVIATLLAVVEDVQTPPSSPSDPATSANKPARRPRTAGRRKQPSSTPGQRETTTELLAEPERSRLTERASKEGLPLRVVAVDFDPASTWLAVRAFQVLNDLGQLGEVCASRPAAREVEDGWKGHKLELVLLSAAPDEVLEATTRAVEDVVGYAVEAIVRDLPSGEVLLSRPNVPSDPRQETDPEPDANRRLCDVGPDGRGKTPQQLLELAGQKIEKLTQNVRVDVERLDKLMNLVGELVIDRNRLHQIGLELRARLGVDEAVDELGEAAQHVARISDELQEEVMRIRMVPIETVFNKFPRMIRSLAQKLGKQIDFVVEGKETELDRSVVEKIDDPVIHLLRNAVDHGIETAEERRLAGKPETATIRLSARQEDNHIVISVEDDGRGIDPANMRAAAVKKGLMSQESADRLDDRSAIDLLFAPGFSTAAATTDISGRGVGMDIVRTNIEKLNGFVAVETELGQGTRFVVKMPLTLAIIRALLVEAGGRKFAVPMTTVVETLRLDPSKLQSLQTSKAVQLRGRVLPIHPLQQLLKASLFQGREPAAVEVEDGKRKMFVVAVRAGERQMGLEVDRFVGQTDIVIKPISGFLGDVAGLAGVTILGDGKLALICDIPSLVTRAGQDHLPAAA